MTWLYGWTEGTARGATVYLVPGLARGQRRAVIRRLRQEAGRGFGPALPFPQLVIALGLDRLRTAARLAGAIVRLHPTVALLPSGLAAALMALFVVSAGGSAISAVLPGGPGAPGLQPASRLVRLRARSSGQCSSGQCSSRQGASGQGLLELARAVDRPPPGSARLGLVERVIGVGDHGRGVGRLGRPFGDARAGGDADPAGP